MDPDYRAKMDKASADYAAAYRAASERKRQTEIELAGLHEIRDAILRERSNSTDRHVNAWLEQHPEIDKHVRRLIGELSLNHAFDDFGNISDADICRYAGVGPATLRKWRILFPGDPMTTHSAAELAKFDAWADQAFPRDTKNARGLTTRVKGALRNQIMHEGKSFDDLFEMDISRVQNIGKKGKALFESLSPPRDIRTRKFIRDSGFMDYMDEYMGDGVLPY